MITPEPHSTNDPATPWMINWGAEPDLAGLQRARAALKSAPNLAIQQLKSLAEMGSETSMICLGNAYLRGTGVEFDIDEAERWYQKAVDRGSIFASHGLGLIKYKKKDFGEAFRLFKIAGEADFGPALRSLGVMYYLGNGVDRNIDSAQKLWEKGSLFGNILCKRDLSRSYMRLEGGYRKIFRGIFLGIVAFFSFFYILFSNSTDHRIS